MTRLTTGVSSTRWMLHSSVVLWISLLQPLPHPLRAMAKPMTREKVKIMNTNLNVKLKIKLKLNVTLTKTKLNIKYY